jgi:transposase
MNNETSQKLEAKPSIIKIAIDMHLKSFRVVRQIEYCAPQPAQKFSPEKFYAWLSKQIAGASEVVVCYEAGCFGYEPARRMQKLGAKVLVIAPQNWDEQGKRQVNDQTDAQVMCRRLSDYLCGHKRALSVVHIPTPEQEQERAQGRLRQQLRKEMRRMQAMGRSLLLAREMPVTGRWWSGALWQKIKTQMPPWVIEQLEIWKKLLEAAEEESRRLEKELKAAAPSGLFFGQGELTGELLRRELVEQGRFKNPRQVGNYFGLCPSESSSGASRRMGSITKHGNPRLRQLMVELAWRTSRFQPHYRAVQKWGPVLAAPAPSRRKKAIVALARRLAVDLWRIATGRVTAASLGLSMERVVTAS